MARIVQKYGGTSVDGNEKLTGIAARVAELRRQGHEVVVVVSAPGVTTDTLLDQARSLAADPAQRELDMLMTAGERISMSLLSIALNSIGCPAVSFTGSQVGIITDTRHTDARILEVRPHRVLDELKAGRVVVVGGFQGVSTAKDVTTLGRGGSDTTAVALAAALEADRCEILTDVDGVYTADPNRVVDARRIAEISYEDMCELARYGAAVLKEDAVLFAERHGIALHVRKSASDAPGTIVLGEPAGACGPVVGLSVLRECELLTWEADAGPELARVMAALSRSARFVVTHGRTTLAAVERAALRAIVGSGGVADALSNGGGATEAVRADLLCAAGRDAGSAESAATALEAVADAGVRVLALVSGGRSMVLAVSPESSGAALEALHSAFFAHAR